MAAIVTAGCAQDAPREDPQEDLLARSQCLEMQPGIVDFGTSVLGTEYYENADAEQDITLVNTCGRPVLTPGLSLDGTTGTPTDRDAFTWWWFPRQNLEPGASYTFSVRFTGGEPGAHRRELVWRGETEEHIFGSFVGEVVEP